MIITLSAAITLVLVLVLPIVVFLLVLRLVGLVNIIDSFIPRPLQVKLGQQGWE